MDAGWLDIGFATALALTAGAFFLVQRGGRVDLFSPTILPAGIIVLAYMVRPVLTHMDPFGWTTFRGDFQAERDDCLVVSFVFAAMFLASFGFAAVRPAPAWAHRFSPSLAPVSTKRVLLLAIALVLVSAAASLHLLSQAGLQSIAAAAVFDNETRMAVLSNLVGEGLTFTLSSSGPLFFALLLASVLVFARQHRFSRLIAAATIALLALCFLIVLSAALVFGSRQMLFGLLLSSLLLIHFFWRRISLGVQLSGAVAIAIGGGALGLLLTTAANVDAIGGYTVMAAVRRLGGTFDQYEMLCVCMRRAPTDFLLGTSVAEDVFWTYLPRAVFTFKPEVFGSVRLQELVLPNMFEIAGLTATFPVGILAEAYLNFGPAGPVLFGYLAGLIIRLGMERARAGEWLYVVLITTIVSGNPVGFVRSLGGVLAALVFFGALFKLLFCIPLFDGARRALVRPSAVFQRI